MTILSTTKDRTEDTRTATDRDTSVFNVGPFGKVRAQVAFTSTKEITGHWTF